MEPFSDPDLLTYMNYFGKELSIPWLIFRFNCLFIRIVKQDVDTYLRMKANYYKPELGRIYV